MTEDEKLEAEALELFNCKNDPRHYFVDSSGSIGKSKLSERTA